MTYDAAMGLMYVMPVDEKEVDRLKIKGDGSVVLKSYGLPMIFWGYLAAILVVLLAMSVAIKGPLLKLYNGEDALNHALAILVAATMALIPIILLCAYFYEKWITKKGSEITLSYRFFFITAYKKCYHLATPNALNVGHFMDSPNMARLKGTQDMRGFMNKGYYELFIKTKDGREIMIDRHSRKADLEKIKTLLCRY